VSDPRQIPAVQVSPSGSPERSVTFSRAGWKGAAAMIVALLAMVLPGVAPSAAAPPTTDGPTAARLGAGWLATQVDGGIPLVNFGSGDWGVTLDAGIALAAGGAGGAQLDTIWAGAVANRELVVNPFAGPEDSVGRLAKFILLAIAVGEDPRAVGAAGPGADLVSRLAALEQPSGLFGTTDPTYDGAFRQGYAIAALVAAGEAVGPNPAQWLEDQQCTNAPYIGAWMPYRASTAVPCAFDGALFVGPDSNSTALAIVGLENLAPASAAIAPAVSWLDANQNADGGWGLFPGDDSEPSSIALVVQSLLAGGAIPAEFDDRAATPLQALLSFQLGCTAPAEDRGSLTYPGSNDAPNLFSTTQSLPGAAGLTVGFVATSITDDVPVVDCTVPTTTTTTTTAAPGATTTTTAPVTPTTRPASAANAGAARPISFAG